jgi:hypothetical protein
MPTRTSLVNRITLFGMIVLFPAVALADDAGFIPIFDGKTLEGWDGNPAFWRVEDGAITGQTTKDNPTQGNTFIIWRQGALDDFELKLEYRIIGGNSGIQYRSFEKPDDPEWKRWVIGGYQADFEAGDTYSGILYGERFRGVLARHRARPQAQGSRHDRRRQRAGQGRQERGLERLPHRRPRLPFHARDQRPTHDRGDRRR